MILRRPYAFLIKHFRLIHIILFILFGYITYMANNMLSFFKEYISYNGNIEIISSNYINNLIFIAVILIVVISRVIFYLMRYKKKPKLFYIVLIIVSIISLVAIMYLYNGIKILETSVLSGKMVRLYRDISRLNLYMLFITCIPVLIRGLGFDIKKFNFNKDLHELNLNEEDSEEVEVNIDFGSDNIKRSSRKTLRELKYYYLENKLVINIIITLLVCVLVSIISFNIFVVNNDFSEGEIFSTDYFNIRVNDSYVSLRNRISKNNGYVVLKIDVMGKVNKYSLDLDEFTLIGDNNSYVASFKYYNYFSDLGIGYRNQYLDLDMYKEYLLIYNVKNVDIEGNFVLKYIGSDRVIKLSPITLK